MVDHILLLEVQQPSKDSGDSLDRQKRRLAHEHAIDVALAEATWR